MELLQAIILIFFAISGIDVLKTEGVSIDSVVEYAVLSLLPIVGIVYAIIMIG